MSEETKMQYYWFEIVGKVYAGSLDHARHTVYWSLDNGDTDSQIIVKEINVDEPISDPILSPEKMKEIQLLEGVRND